MNQSLRATLIGTIAQIVMVVAGRYVVTVTALFALGGQGGSALAGGLMGRRH